MSNIIIDWHIPRQVDTNHKAKVKYDFFGLFESYPSMRLSPLGIRKHFHNPRIPTHFHIVAI